MRRPQLEPRRHTTSTRRALLGVLIGGALVSACQDETPTTTGGSPRVPPMRAQAAANDGGITGPRAKQGDARTQITKALRGRRVRGGQDDMLRVESVAAGFAGYFLDADERVVLLQKPTPQVTPSLVRQLVHNLYADSPSDAVRLLMASAREAEVREARFSLSELIEMEQSVLSLALDIPGFTGVGVIVPQNLVEVYLTDEASVDAARAAVRSLRMPVEAFRFDVRGSFSLTGDWDDRHRPTFGGVYLDLYDGRHNFRSGPDSFFVTATQSLGYNVRLDNQTGQPTVMLTAAHGVNGYATTNGYTGLPVYQPFCPAASGSNCAIPVATITTNPPWSTSCETGIDFCTFADVAAATYTNGVSGLRGVGTSTTQGNEGNAGSFSINGVYAISSSIDPVMVPVGRRNVFKSGWNTGTTAGTIRSGVTDFLSSAIPWGSSVPGTPTRSLLVQSQVFVDSIGAGKGDSGGPVFVRITKSGVCNEYCAVGIAIGAGPNVTGPGDRCSVGTSCWIAASPWAAMQTQLGLGTLNPKTNP